MRVFPRLRRSLMNYSTQIRIDVTISGSIFSGDGLIYNHSTLPSALPEANYMDYVVDATFATYTVVPAVRTCCALDLKTSVGRTIR